MVFVVLWKPPEGVCGLLSVRLWTARESLQGWKKASSVLVLNDVRKAAVAVQMWNTETAEK